MSVFTSLIAAFVASTNTEDVDISNSNQPTNNLRAHNGTNATVVTVPMDTTSYLFDMNMNTTDTRNLNDLGLRFNKFPFPQEPGSLVPGGAMPAALAAVLPLTATDAPLSDDLAMLLQNTTLAHSILLPSDYECLGDNRTEWIERLGGIPAYPSSDPNSSYWDEFRTVVEVQIDRRNNESAATLIPGLPDMWKDFTLEDAATAVHHPVLGNYHRELLVIFNAQGLKLDETIFAPRGNRDFIGREVRLNELLTWAIGTVAPLDFMIKWTVVMPRPEEIAWKITTKELTTEDGVPEDIVKDVMSMKLPGAVNFTAFPEGCPPHPSWPAMHAASASASLWLPIVTHLSPEQYCQVLRLDYAYAFARTAAGVHYPMDNIAGLQFAQGFIATRLANHLAERYGSDPAVVTAKMQPFLFDWNTFDPETCTFESGSSSSSSSTGK